MDNTYTNKNICLYSYNSRGFSEDKQDICKILMCMTGDNLPILCNQENFLLNNNGYKIRQCLPQSHIFFKQAIKDSIQGRPMNGMFIAVPNSIKENIQDVSPSHWRVQAIIVRTLTSNILVINSYLPTDPKLRDFDASEVLTTLSAINDVINDNEFDNLIWTGDLNADFSRNTPFVKLLTEFIDTKDLIKSWDKFPIDFTRC